MSIKRSGSAVFVGCARSCSPHLDAVLKNLEALSSTYERSAVVVFENDSEDDTLARLEAYRSTRRGAFILSQPGLSATVGDRTKRLALARNACLEFVRTSPYRDFDDLVVLDFDDVNAGPIAVEPFVAARAFLASRQDLRGVFANPQPIYYDIWALRHPVWCPNDCWVEARASGEPGAASKFVYSRMLPIPPTAAPIEVASAFGGLGVYKMASALRGEYSDPTPVGSEQCEHVLFHQSILEQSGGGFAIFPPLTNQTAWEHVLPEFANQLRRLTLAQQGRSCDIVVPADHQLGQYRAQHPLYDQRLPALSRLVSDAAPGSTFIDIGANVGDTAALCRLAGCSLDIQAIEASLSYFKLFKFNIQRQPELFGGVEASWAFVGRAEDQAPLFLQGGTASIISSVSSSGRLQNIEVNRVPMIALATFVDRKPSLIKIDTDGYDHVIINNNLKFLEDTKPIIWTEAQSETPDADEAWRELLLRLSHQWPWLMAFDNYGFCVLSGRTSEQWRTCADLIALARRYRRAESSRFAGAPQFYYLDLALFPERFSAVFESFRLSLAELSV